MITHSDGSTSAALEKFYLDIRSRMAAEVLQEYIPAAVFCLVPPGSSQEVIIVEEAKLAGLALDILEDKFDPHNPDNYGRLGRWDQDYRVGRVDAARKKFWSLHAEVKTRSVTLPVDVLRSIIVNEKHYLDEWGI